MPRKAKVAAYAFVLGYDVQRALRHPVRSHLLVPSPVNQRCTSCGERQDNKWDHEQACPP